MPLYPRYTCSRCRQEFDFEKIKYDERKNLVCVDCLHKQRAEEKKQLILERKEAIEQSTDGKVNFICVSCRFKFRIPKDKLSGVKCPYCGKSQVMHVKKYKDEDDLIKDAQDPRFNY